MPVQGLTATYAPYVTTEPMACQIAHPIRGPRDSTRIQENAFALHIPRDGKAFAVEEIPNCNDCVPLHAQVAKSIIPLHATHNTLNIWASFTVQLEMTYDAL